MYHKFVRKNKMKLLSIFKNNDIKQPVLQWSSCKQPKTLSFRTGNDMFKTTNSVYYDPLAIDPSCEEGNHIESCFINSSSSQSTSSTHEVEGSDEFNVERIIREARSERLFFEPGKEDTRSILKVGAKKEEEEEEEEEESNTLLMRESVVMAMESEDPYLDFKSSMQEMVETHGLKDWESLEELLGLYLKMNGKMNHGYIIGAFVDLLIGLCFSSSSRCCSCCCSCSEHDHTFMSASSSFSSPSSCSSLSQAPKRENGGKRASQGRCIAPDL